MDNFNISILKQSIFIAMSQSNQQSSKSNHVDWQSAKSIGGQSVNASLRQDNVFRLNNQSSRQNSFLNNSNISGNRQDQNQQNRQVGRPASPSSQLSQFIKKASPNKIVDKQSIASNGLFQNILENQSSSVLSKGLQSQSSNGQKSKANELVPQQSYFVNEKYLQQIVENNQQKIYLKQEQNGSKVKTQSINLIQKQLQEVQLASDSKSGVQHQDNDSENLEQNNSFDSQQFNIQQHSRAKKNQLFTNFTNQGNNLLDCEDKNQQNKPHAVSKENNSDQFLKLDELSLKKSTQSFHHHHFIQSTYSKEYEGLREGYVQECKKKKSQRQDAYERQLFNGSDPNNNSYEDFLSYKGKIAMPIKQIVNAVCPQNDHQEDDDDFLMNDIRISTKSVEYQKETEIQNGQEFVNKPHFDKDRNLQSKDHSQNIQINQTDKTSSQFRGEQRQCFQDKQEQSLQKIGNINHDPAIETNVQYRVKTDQLRNYQNEFQEEDPKGNSFRNELSRQQNIEQKKSLNQDSLLREDSSIRQAQQQQSLKYSQNNIGSNQRFELSQPKIEVSETTFKTQIFPTHFNLVNSKISRIKASKQYKKNRLQEQLAKINQQLQALELRQSEIKEVKNTGLENDKRYNSNALKFNERLKINNDQIARSKAKSLVRQLKEEKELRNSNKQGASMIKIERNINDYMTELSNMRKQNESRFKEKKKLEIIQRMKKKQSLKLYQKKKIQANSKFVSQVKHSQVSSNDFFAQIPQNKNKQSYNLNQDEHSDSPIMKRKSSSKNKQYEQMTPQLANKKAHLNKVRNFSDIKKSSTKKIHLIKAKINNTDLYQQQLY